MLATLALAHLLRACAPQIGPVTMASIVRVESAGAANAIHDNDTGRSFDPADTPQAVRLASALVGAGHSVDLGLAQINSANLAPLGLSVAAAFDPCTNLRAGASVLADAYRHARQRFGPGQFALRRALGAYNTGSLSRGDTYIAAVVAAAEIHWLHGGAADRSAAALGAPVAVRRHEPRPRPRPRADAHVPLAPAPQDAPVLVPVTVVSTGVAL